MATDKTLTIEQQIKLLEDESASIHQQIEALRASRAAVRQRISDLLAEGDRTGRREKMTEIRARLGGKTVFPEKKD